MSFIQDIKRFVSAKGSALAACALLSMTALTSCYDDPGISSDREDENFTGITLYIPNVEKAAEFGATRNDGYADTRAYDQAKETNFNTLYIAAVDENKKVQTFMKTTNNGIDEDDYSMYRVNLAPGKYKFYVVANLNRYIPGSDTFADVAKEEDDIRNLVLNFTADVPLEPGFLPMACLAENIKAGNSASSANRSQFDNKGYIDIPAGSGVKLYADLNYLCAKVRYTILFDRDKSEFSSLDMIDVHRHVNEKHPYATMLRQNTKLEETDFNDNVFLGVSDPNDETTTYHTWSLYLDRYHYPSFKLLDGEGKPQGEAFDIYQEWEEQRYKDAIKYGLAHMTEWQTGDGDWNTVFKDKRAWQGVTYLPENLLTATPTKLVFPYSFNGQLGESSPRELKLDWQHEVKGTTCKGIQRAKQYDVYVLIKNPDDQQWILDVLVQDWTLQNMSYLLHGPYELVVETTEIKELSMAEDVTFWFRSDIPPSEIGFLSPQVSSTGVVRPEDMKDIFKGKVVTDDEGNYVTNENGDYLFQVGINADELPYKVLDSLNHGGITYKDENGVEHTYGIEDVSYFHLIAGSLYKRIEIKKIDLDPYLNVDPQMIIIDTREYYTSGLDNPVIPPITFETNVDLFDNQGQKVEGISLTLTDPGKLIGDGVADGDLSVSIPNYIVKEGEGYTINRKTGEIKLNIYNIISGNPFWDRNSEFTLYFTLRVERQNEKDLEIVKPVTIKVKPFSGTYVIHFRDNMKEWKDAHIYIFQDLTLPANMQVRNDDGSLSKYEHAGRIVGYIEQNPTSGFQWNAAVQYIFTNNLSFRGWHGSHIGKKENGKYVSEGEDEYGGPSLNNPWAEAYYHDWNPDGTETELNTNTSTMGFVMFGQPYKAPADSRVMTGEFSFWNYDYSYNVTYGLTPSGTRMDRYNYDVNFNYDHEQGIGKWGCATCRDMQPDYNGTYDQYQNANPRFYPGISMEKEEDGWWKYTLTGVAQPGRTMIIFANWHEPWIPEHDWFDYRAEDYRWPGDYEAGLPLFDFEDNEGWFLFDGNTSNNDQKFTDNKPTNIIPYNFSAAYSNLTIEVMVPTSGSISSVAIGTNTENASASSRTDGNGHTINAYEFSGVSASGETLDVKVTVGGTTKTYTLRPRNFKTGGKGHITAQPLYFEFASNMKFYVKWNDQVEPNDSYWYSEKQNDSKQVWRELLFYHPSKTTTKKGSNYLNVYWGNNGTWGNKMESYPFTGKEIGNYKYIEFETLTPTGSQDKMELRLCTTASGDNNFYKVVSVEDLPEYYYPEGDEYLINWHFLKSPYDPAKPW